MMSYHLKAKEPVPEGLKRIVTEELESAASQLEGKGEADTQESIHEARKSVKKVRAALRLMQPELGRVYRTESRRMRDIGRELSEIRDAGAIIETFDGLKERFHDELGRGSLTAIRRALSGQKDEAERDARAEGVLAELAARFRGILERVPDWPLHATGFDALDPGLKKTYRRGRDAFAEATRHPLPENYHEWRKRVKDNWYHIRLMEHVWTDAMKGYEKSLKDLETWLGDDHNLVVLREKIAGDPAVYGKQADIDHLLELIGKYQTELRKNSVALGERIYNERPRLFIKRMRTLWYTWEPSKSGAPEPQSKAGVEAKVS